MTATVSNSLADFDLDAKYRVTDGGVLLTGIQALVRVVFDQIRADRRRGLSTAAFVSGYPGSPLGGFDQTLQRTGALLAEHDVHWVPGVNEDLAATAVWGSQQDNLAPLDRHDGVIGMWYGKAPGVDRCGDVFRHANLHGVGTNGGVICAAGDDPQSKSSTLPGASEVGAVRRGHADPRARHRPGGARPRPARLRAVALHRLLDRAEDRHRGRGRVRLGRRRPRPDLAAAYPELSFDGQPWRYKQRPTLLPAAHRRARGRAVRAPPPRGAGVRGRERDQRGGGRPGRRVADDPAAPAAPTARSARPWPTWAWPATRRSATPGSGWSGSG